MARRHDDGVLTLDPEARPEISGQLEHSRFDTCLSSWTDLVWGQSLVHLELDDAGKVSQIRFAVRPDWIDTLEYVFVQQ